jgi:hypothetical protein
MVQKFVIFITTLEKNNTPFLIGILESLMVRVRVAHHSLMQTIMGAANIHCFMVDLARTDHLMMLLVE